MFYWPTAAVPVGGPGLSAIGATADERLTIKLHFFTRITNGPPVAAQAAPQEKKQPAHKASLGALESAVWANETLNNETGEVRVWYTVDILRNYIDKNNVWQKTSQLREGDVANAIVLLQNAQQFILSTGK